MGLAAAGTVAVAVLVAITLLPALLGFAGQPVLRAGSAPGAARRRDAGERLRRSAGRGWSPGCRRAGADGRGARPRRARDPGRRTCGSALPDAAPPPPDTTAARGVRPDRRGLRPGLQRPPGRCRRRRDSPAGHAAAAGEVGRGASRAPRTWSAVTPAAAQRRTATTALVAVIPKTGPTDEATEDLVHDIRDQVAHDRAAPRSRSPAQTAVGIDVSDKLADALPVYLLIVVGLSVLLLMLVFRSVLVPLKAALGFLLTVGATVRHHRRGLPVGLAGRPARRRHARAAGQLPADPADRHPVRPGDGLRGLPGLADAGGLRARRPAAAGDDQRAWATAPGWSPPPRSS